MSTTGDGPGSRAARWSARRVDQARGLVKGTPVERPVGRLAAWVRAALGPGPAVGGSSRSAGTASPPMFVEPGHFYSPIPSLVDIDRQREWVSEPAPDALRGIDLRLDAQRSLLESFRTFYDEQPFPAARTAGTRFWFENHSFSYADALALHCMLRRLQPKRIIEVGSGWSSCVILDTCERFLDWRPEITMIEPYPDQLLQLVEPGDLERCRLLATGVQDVPTSEFEALEDGDVLFIDSTHVSRLGSDVNHELFEILPTLQRGVHVHFHDIFFPFEYPLDWSEEGRAWNEAYLLRAFLEYNDAFEIVLFNDLVGRRLRGLLEDGFPLWLRNPGGSLWLRKCR